MGREPQPVICRIRQTEAQQTEICKRTSRIVLKKGSDIMNMLRSVRIIVDC
jgi:hypothetical protein